MGNLTTATVFILFLNLLMLLANIAIIDINPDGTICNHVNGSMLDDALSTSDLSVATVRGDVDLPGGQQSVDSGDTTIFTDIFNSVLNWFKELPGVNYIYGVVVGPYNILKCMGLPNEFTVLVGAVWYLITTLALIIFLRGGGD